MPFSDLFPSPETLLDLEPEDVAALLLLYLQELPRHPFSKYNLFLQQSAVGKYAGTRYEEVVHVLAEGWIVLEREGLVAHEPSSNFGMYFLTRRGRSITTKIES